MKSETLPNMVKLHSIFLITPWYLRPVWVCLDLFDWQFYHFSVSFVVLGLVGMNDIFITIICSRSDLQFPSSHSLTLLQPEQMYKKSDYITGWCMNSMSLSQTLWNAGLDSNPGTIDTAYYVLRFIESKDNLINLRQARNKTKTNFKQATASKIQSKLHKLNSVQNLEVKIQRAQEKTGARYSGNMQPADKVIRRSLNRWETKP